MDTIPRDSVLFLFGFQRSHFPLFPGKEWLTVYDKGIEVFVSKLMGCYCKSSQTLGLFFWQGLKSWQAVEGETGTFHSSAPLGQMKDIHGPNTTPRLVCYPEPGSFLIGYVHKNDINHKNNNSCLKTGTSSCRMPMYLTQQHFHQHQHEQIFPVLFILDQIRSSYIPEEKREQKH